MRTAVMLCLALLAVVLYQNDSLAANEEWVMFESAPYRVGAIQQRLAQERAEPLTLNTGARINGYLSKPDGAGPFPAIVYLHGCSGLAKSTRDRIAKLMTGWGYATLAVDSFGTRGIQEACDRPMPPRLADALGALLYLSKLPFVDPNRIAVVGASQGGIVALELASVREAKVFEIPDDKNFKAAVAYYPFCSAAADLLAIPTLILIGQNDDWAPANACESWMARRAGKGAFASLVVYPGASHGFDVPSLQNGMQSFGHLLKYDADAAQRSMVEMHNFLQAQFAK